jgi:asparagine synthase (glutamine-hydrolysing)
LGCKILAELDGFYSGIIYQSGTHTLNLLRDHIGKKPLFYGKSKGNIFVVSELKALQTVEWFEQVPLGLSQLDLDTGELVHLVEHKFSTDKRLELSTALELAVVKRLPNQPFGIFLSGGLDSSIIAALANKHRKDIVYFALGNPNSPDVEKVKNVVEHLGLTQVRFISLPSEQAIPELIASVVFATESYNPSIISNGLATFLLARAAHNEGLKVVLTGDGADELFGGYYEDMNEQAWLTTRLKLINDMRFTELRRLDSCTMANSIEARCPFLDRVLRDISEGLQHQNFYQGGQNKVALRDNFKHLLPVNIANRKKKSFDVGSGIRRSVVNYLTQNGKKEVETLEAIWLSLFDLDKDNSYFYSYPIFDAAIAKRGEVHR